MAVRFHCFNCENDPFWGRLKTIPDDFFPEVGNVCPVCEEENSFLIWTGSKKEVTAIDPDQALAELQKQSDWEPDEVDYLDEDDPEMSPQDRFFFDVRKMTGQHPLHY